MEMGGLFISVCPFLQPKTRDTVSGPNTRVADDFATSMTLDSAVGFYFGGGRQRHRSLL